MTERVEIREGQREETLLEGHQFEAKFIGVRRSAELWNRGCYSDSKYRVFWWEGQGEIIDKIEGARHRFLFETPGRCTCCFYDEKAYIHTLAGSIVSFEIAGETSVALRPILVDELQIIDLALQKLIDQVKEFESKPQEERKSLIPKITPVLFEMKDLIDSGLVFDPQGQLHMVLS